MSVLGVRPERAQTRSPLVKHFTWYPIFDKGLSPFVTSFVHPGAAQIILPLSINMETILELVNTEQPYTFKSLGIYNKGKYDVSTLFPIDTIVKLTEGTFPIASFKDAYEHSKQTHTLTLGGKQVRLIGNNNACYADTLNKYDKCMIEVEVHSTAGGRRNRRNRRTNRARRNRNRFSRRK